MRAEKMSQKWPRSPEKEPLLPPFVYVVVSTLLTVGTPIDLYRLFFISLAQTNISIPIELPKITWNSTHVIFYWYSLLRDFLLLPLSVSMSFSLFQIEANQINRRVTVSRPSLIVSSLTIHYLSPTLTSTLFSHTNQTHTLSILTFGDKFAGWIKTCPFSLSAQLTIPRGNKDVCVGESVIRKQRGEGRPSSDRKDPWLQKGQNQEWRRRTTAVSGMGS